MKFICKKCKTKLTKDLYLSQSYRLKYKKLMFENDYFYDENFDTGEIFTNIADPDSFEGYLIDADRQFEIHKGSFVKNKTYYYGELVYSINKDSLVNCTLPEFNKKNGCCNHHFEKFYCDSCGEHLGYLNYDCVQYIHSTDFLRDKVEFKYKNG